MMRESLAAVFTEAKTPTHCNCDDVAQQLQPMIQVALNVQKEIAAMREKMVTASLEDPTFDGNVERMEQTLKSMERRSAAIIAEGRGLRDDFRQLGRYAREIETDVNTHLEHERVAAERAATIESGDKVAR